MLKCALRRLSKTILKAVKEFVAASTSHLPLTTPLLVPVPVTGLELSLDARESA